MSAADRTVEGFGLSPQQRRVWQLLGSAARGVYCVRVAAATTHGDPDAVERAVQATAERHEILRTRFRRVPGMGLPIQEIGATSRIEVIRRRKRRGAPEDLWPEALDELDRAILDPAEGPLAALSITPLADSSRTLICALLSALVADARTALNLLGEIHDRCVGTGGVPHDEPIQYADAAEVFEELLVSEDTREGREAWHRARQLVAGGLPEPAFARPGAGELRFSPRRLLDRPDGASPAPPTSPAPDADLEERFGLPGRAVRLAAWSVVVARHTGWSEPLIGVRFPGRSYEGLDEAFGTFVRVVPVACAVRDPEPFRDLAERLAADLDAAEERQEYFDWPDGGSESLRVAFGGDPLALPPDPGLQVLCVTEQIDRADVDLVSVPAGGRAVTGLRYDAARVPEPAAVRLLEGLRAVLDAVTDSPEAVVGTLDGLSPSLRRRLLVDLAAPADRTAPFSDSRQLHELMVEQAERSPDATALTAGPVSLSYGELRRRVARLAAALRQRGVDAGDRVLLCLDRSSRQVVALLGILEAGAAYLPVDPTFPPARVSLILDQANPRAAVADREAAGRLPLADLVGEDRLLLLDDEAGAVTAGSAGGGPGAPTSPSSPGAESLAYVLYTSGSTGRPKGVMVPHRAIVNRIRWMIEAFAFGSGDAVLAKTPVTFDASIWEIVAPLASGGRVALAAAGEERDGEALLRTATRERVTVLQLVPSHLRAILDEAPEPCPSLQRLFCGGEALPVDLAERAAEGWGAVVCNLYGPTEAAIDSTFQPVDRRFGTAIVPIGRPIANARAVLLDRALRPVPPGVAGKLHVAGPGLAHGYLGDPARTAERFVPDLSSPDPGGRVYRTGDIARLLLSAAGEVDGTLLFAGRVDYQVKIRGVRVELGEPAAILREHPAVRDAVVLACDGPGGARMLVAYVAADEKRGLTAELRSFAAARLPDAAVPAHFVRMDALPLKDNGKLDRSALPSPESAARADSASAPARTQTEQIVAGILEEVLGIEGVGARSSYLELGGHSLLATQVISRIRNTFQVEVPLKILFETPRVEELARRVETEREAGRGIEIPPLAPRTTAESATAPLSFAQQRLWFLDQLQPGGASFNSSIGLWLDGLLYRRALARSLRAVVERHQVLRTVFPDCDGKPFQKILPPPRRVLPLVDLAGLPAERREPETRRLAIATARRPFDLQRGPLLRARLVRVSDERHAVLFTLHHICGDGWSTGLLVREVSTLYEAFRMGRPSPLPRLTVQYADFASWQRSWLRAEVLRREGEHWKRQLAGAPPTIALPTDRRRPALPSGAGARFSFELDAELVAGLRRLARGDQATLFMVVMAAFQALLFLRSDQGDLVVGTDVANRNRAEVEGLIGFFVNQLALRARLSRETTFRELLRQVRTTTLDAYDHQDLPFDKLVEAVRPDRRSERVPLFQIKLNFQNTPSTTLELDGLRVSRLEVRRDSSQLDLIVNLEEAGDVVRGSAELDTDLWREDTVRELIEDYRLLLAHWADQPDAPLSAGREVLAAAGRERRETHASEFGEAGLRMLRDRLRRSRAPACLPVEGGESRG